MDIVVTQATKEYFTRKYGQHLSFYINNRLEVCLYSKYVWYLELLRAANIYKPFWYKVWYKAYTKFVKWYLSILYKKTIEENKPDDETVIFAVALNRKGKSIGSLLLNELLKNGRGQIMASTETISDFHYYLKIGEISIKDI